MQLCAKKLNLTTATTKQFLTTTTITTTTSTIRNNILIKFERKNQTKSKHRKMKQNTAKLEIKEN